MEFQKGNDSRASIVRCFFPVGVKTMGESVAVVEADATHNKSAVDVHVSVDTFKATLIKILTLIQSRR